MKRTILAASILSLLSGTAFAATYQLTELPRHQNSKNTFISDVNEAGDIIGAASYLFDIPIDVTYLDFEDGSLVDSYNRYVDGQELINREVTFTLEDIKNGVSNTNADAKAFMLSYIAGRDSSYEFQKLNDRIGLKISATSADELVLFDEITDFSGTYSRSVANYLTAITEDSVIAGWGSAPYKKEIFSKEGEEDKTVFVREWPSRGLVISPNGERVILEPEFSTYGGYSIATDIVKLDSGNYIAVGSSSISVPENRQTNYDENCDGVDEPVSVCVWNYLRGNFYNTEAYQWELDANFNVINKTKLGLGITRQEDEKDAFNSLALATNKNGIAAGYSDARNEEGDSKYSYPQAGYYKDGEFVRIHKHESYIQGSKAIDINDDNVVIGNYFEQYGSVVRKKVGFYYDINTSTYNEIPDFFNGSETTVRDINNEGQVVGQGEIEKNTSVPKNEAFIFNIGDDKVTNINDLLPCKADTGEAFPYTIAEATKITDSGKIYAIATKTVERKNRLGQVMKDSDGEVEFEAVTVPVLLSPIAGGTPDECTPPEAEVYERQSASFSFLSLFALPLLWMRRRKTV